MKQRKRKHLAARKRASSLAKDLRTPKYRQRVEVDRTKYNRKRKDYDLYQ
jgi:hypothetical protein